MSESIDKVNKPNKTLQHPNEHDPSRPVKIARPLKQPFMGSMVFLPYPNPYTL